MNSTSYAKEIIVGEWHVNAATGGIERDGEFRRLEPKVMDLLLLLASRAGEAVSRDDILAELWPGVVVGDDALPRCISKLRRALDDDAQAPRFIQTIPKRGYRLLGAEPLEAAPNHARWLPATVMVLLVSAASVAAVAWFTAEPRPDDAVPVTEIEALIEQGANYYSRYTRQDNESAIELFERALALDPDNARAMSGLANALGQRALRWPNESSRPPPEHSTLTKALGEGRLELPNARLNLDAARALAEQSVEIAPESAASFKALGLIQSAQGDIDAAIASYEHALDINPDAWGAMINLAELYGYKGDAARELELLESTYALQPTYAELGVLIGEKYEAMGKLQEARLRYRNVLSYAPFHRDATLSFARVLSQTGEAAEAARYCERLVERTGPFPPCETFLSGR